MLVLGLTGSIGMGKTTTAALFREEGIPVFDSDAEVHRLYRGEAVPLIETAFPGTTSRGSVDRQRLGSAILGDPGSLGRLEGIVHPLVRAQRATFFAAAAAAGKRLAVVDIPLLFESGAERDVDVILVVSASLEIQRERVLARPGMDRKKFEALLARQMPDAEKRSRAHLVLDSGHGIEAARREVRGIIRALAGMTAGGADARDRS